MIRQDHLKKKHKIKVTSKPKTPPHLRLGLIILCAVPLVYRYAQRPQRLSQHEGKRLLDAVVRGSVLL